MNIKEKLLATGASIALAGIMAFSNPAEASATEFTPETWEARTVDQIKEDIKANEKGSKYVFTWGDTLSAIAAATDISLNTLIDVNNIANADMIIAGNAIYLSADHKVVTVGEGEEAKSYDVSEEVAVEVETPVEEIEEYNQIEEKAVETAPVVEEKVEAPVTTSASEGYTMHVEATAYSTNQPSLSDYTFSGINLRVNPWVVAVDPNVIPLGSTIIVPGYGTYIAGDTGGDIKGNRIDVHITNLDAAWAFGRQSMTITVIPPK